MVSLVKGGENELKWSFLSRSLTYPFLACLLSMYLYGNNALKNKINIFLADFSWIQQAD